MARIIKTVKLQAEPVVISYRISAPEVIEPVAHAVDVLPEPAPDLPLYLASSLRTEAPADDEGPSIEELRQQAQQDGYREGYEAGQATATTELSGEIQRFSGLSASISEALEGQIEGLEDVMLDIAFSAACKVLGEASVSEDGVRSVVREAMHLVLTREGTMLRISPADYATVSSRSSSGRPICDDPKVQIVADERVTVGGCLIETNGGTLDARLEIQLRQIADTLARARNAQAEV